MRPIRQSCNSPRIATGRLFVAGLAMLTASGLVSSSRAAETGSLDFDEGSVRYTMYAPEWIWQGGYINIIMILDSELATTATIRASLGFPAFNAHAFSYDAPRVGEQRLGKEARGRIVFANILARQEHTVPAAADAEGKSIRTVEVQTDSGEVRVEKVRTERIEPGHFAFTIELTGHSGGTTRTARLHYPVTTVRGAVVREGPASRWLPVLLILGWCVLIFLIVPRLGKPGAWRRSSDPFEVSENGPSIGGGA